MARLIDCTTMHLWKYTNYPNHDADLENQALQRVMLVAKQHDATLKGFTRDGSNSCDLMDKTQYNPPWIVLHESWILHLKVRTDRDPMLFKPGGQINHVHPASVANERALASFVRDEVLTKTKIRYERFKNWVKLVRDGQVEQLYTQVYLVGSAPDSH